MNRLFGIAVILLWGSAVIALVRRDVLPYWEAHRPPRGVIPQERLQAGLYAGPQRIGASQTTVRRFGGITHVRSVTELALGAMRLPGLSALPRVTFVTTLTFQGVERLESFETQVHGAPAPIHVEGHLLGIDYSCLAKFGALQHKFSLDARLSQQLGEALRPFTHLPDLELGQTWQVQALDPVGLMTGQTAQFRPMLVRVVGRDRIPHRGAEVECFRLESDHAWAWVDRDGRVLVQVIELPLLGKLTIRDEPFDDELSARFKSQHGR